MMGDDDDDGSRRREAYMRWLLSESVRTSPLVETTRRNVAAGWGCVVLSDVREGTVLFEVPRGACLVADETEDDDGGGDGDKGEAKGGDGDGGGDNDEDPTTSDTQMGMALCLLRCKRLGPKDGWAPFLDMLTPHPLPWTWPESFRRDALRGTELEKVAEVKVRRVREEYGRLPQLQKARRRDDDDDGGLDFSYEEYLDACALAAR